MIEALFFLFGPLAIIFSLFIIMPFVAAVPAALFCLLFWRKRQWPALIAGLLWLVYAAYETGMYYRILCTGECNIRIDLVLIYPLLATVSLAAIAWSSWRWWRGRSREVKKRPFLPSGDAD